MARYIIDGEGDIMHIPFKGDNYKILRMATVTDDAYEGKDLEAIREFWKDHIKTKEDAKKFIKDHNFLNSLNAMWGMFRNAPESNIDGLVLVPKRSLYTAAQYFNMAEDLLMVLMEDN